MKVPYVIVSGDDFPLTPQIMKSYQGKNMTKSQIIYYRLSRARRVVENAFGVLANRFRIYKSDILASFITARTYVLATCVLHNFLRSRCLVDSANSRENPDGENCETSNLNGALRNIAIKSHRQGAFQAKQVQSWFSNYFYNIGAVPWQEDMALLH